MSDFIDLIHAPMCALSFMRRGRFADWSNPARCALAGSDGAAAEGLCVDKAYDADEVRTVAAEFGFTDHIRARGEEEQTRERPVLGRSDAWSSAYTLG